ncbi:lysine N(6)-hydroxylase/L-ornithine N(5)-oxygenase family protein [Flavobacterium sp. JP2137]|uniref:lysine N(6)-hydroxylase/L-ornithine N(5)-oxygenase family protein n=1 Tax=Flavobacterium sp. JP2137 TaxID=3414510 RepID=UPI003D2FD9F6
MKTTIYDLVGIGIGPFNLGMAALSHSLPLKTLFFDGAPAFDWHRGLMIEGSTLQVPFLADLVSSVAPTNPYSYINYLVQKGSLFKFCIKESFYITRTEYNAYCRWVASALPSLLFSHRVTALQYNNSLEVYEVSVHDLCGRCTKTYYAKRLVLGTGTVPNILECVENCSREQVFHSSQYTYRRPYLKPQSVISIVGSGQSAAEIFQDLLLTAKEKGYRLNWISQAERFFPMENSKFTFEHTSPDYLHFFYALSEKKRNELLGRQDALYKGINQAFIDAIYDQLYQMELYSDSPLPICILPATQLEAIEAEGEGGFKLALYHLLQERNYELKSDYVILATGYKHQESALLTNINNRLRRQESGKLVVDAHYAIDVNGKEVYVLNAELESHGILTADLSMGPYRNAIILNDILQEEHFKLEKKITFQHFGIPDDRDMHQGKQPHC